MWMYKSRNLTLKQRVVVLNIFITSKLWLLASVISIPNQAVGRLTSYIGSFIWERFPTRVPIEQLTQPKQMGGLNLHLPMHKCKALLVARFLKEIDQMPFASSYTQYLQNPPNFAAIPALYPCLKTIAKLVPYIPGRCSGSLLNFSKLFAVNIGPQRNENGPIWPTVRDSVNVLGVRFFNSQKKKTTSTGAILEYLR